MLWKVASKAAERVGRVVAANSRGYIVTSTFALLFFLFVSRVGNFALTFASISRTCDSRDGAC